MPEKIVARIMRAKGYLYCCQFSVSEGSLSDPSDFGEPVYFKSSLEVGPFMREHNLKMTWTKPIEELCK